MTPGSQFHVKTNLDKSALLKSSIHYRLSFSNEEQAKFCSNQTVQVSEEGVVTAKYLEHHQLKSARQCIANLLVYVDEQQSSQGADQTLTVKQQTLAYTIKIKPVIYSMVHLRKYAAMPISTAAAFLNNVQTKWQVSYHDDLGDMFDVISPLLRYSLSRNDLIDFSQMNKNVFVASSVAGEKGESVDSGKLAAYASVSVLANAAENSFLVRTLKPGRFVMELTPASACNQVESRDYLSMTIDEKSGVSGGNGFGSRQLETRIGDVVCLVDNEFLASDFVVDLAELEYSKTFGNKNAGELNYFDKFQVLFAV